MIAFRQYTKDFMSDLCMKEILGNEFMMSLSEIWM